MNLIHNIFEMQLIKLSSHTGIHFWLKILSILFGYYYIVLWLLYGSIPYVFK